MAAGAVMLFLCSRAPLPASQRLCLCHLLPDSRPSAQTLLQILQYAIGRFLDPQDYVRGLSLLKIFTVNRCIRKIEVAHGNPQLQDKLPVRNLFYLLAQLLPCPLHLLVNPNLEIGMCLMV